MALIIRKLKYKENDSAVRMIDTEKENFEDVSDFEFEGRNYRIAKYETRSNPVKSHRLTYETVYKGSIEDSPVQIFDYEDGKVFVDQEKVSARLADKYGPGQYNVFKFGGNPPKEDYFKNRFIEKIEEPNEAGEA
jgi:hypothetical protein